MSSRTRHAVTTIKAVTQYRYGGVDTLEYETVARPIPAQDQVLIRVEGASINAADWLLTQGEPFIVRLMFGLLRQRGLLPRRWLARRSHRHRGCGDRGRDSAHLRRHRRWVATGKQEEAHALKATGEADFSTHIHTHRTNRPKTRLSWWAVIPRELASWRTPAKR